MTRLSLRWRLGLALAAVLALLIALDVALTLYGASSRVDPEIADATALTSEILREATRGLKDTPDLDARLQTLAGGFDRLRHVRVSFRPENGAAPLAPSERRAPPAWFVALVNPRVAAPTTISALAEGRRVGVFVVAGDPADEIGELWDSLVELSLDGIASAILGLLLVYLVVRAALAPLTRLNAGLAALERHDYAARLPENAAAEFQTLLTRFNALGVALGRAERDNRALRARLVSIQDEERKEIARELHDEFGPYLFAARAQAGAARTSGPESLDGLICTLDALQSTNRRLLDRLRPTALEELGLAAALRALGRFFETNSPGLTVAVEVADPPALPADFETALYRIAQEALTNVARHAGATQAQIRLEIADGGLALRIADDGRGLDAARAPGRGLIGMRERAAAHDGALALDPLQPHGLAVTARFPLPA